MIAPEELSRKRKTPSGEMAAAMTQRNPTTVDVRIAAMGTPRLLTVIRLTGASRRAASTNSIRDAVYSPELRQDRTAVSTTAFMTWSAYGIPISFSALTYGDEPRSLEFHGKMTIATTWMPANQNSNSPNARTEYRLVAVIRIMMPSESNHSGASIQ